MRTIVFIIICLFTTSAYSAEWREHKVVWGDTISEFAWTMKIDRAKLVEWNPEFGTRNIKPGDVLRYKTKADEQAEIMAKLNELSVSLQDKKFDTREDLVEEIKTLKTQLNGDLVSVSERLESLEEVINNLPTKVASATSINEGRINASLQSSANALNNLEKTVKNSLESITEQASLKWAYALVIGCAVIFLILAVVVMFMISASKRRSSEENEIILEAVSNVSGITNVVKNAIISPHWAKTPVNVNEKRYKIFIDVTDEGRYVCFPDEEKQESYTFFSPSDARKSGRTFLIKNPGRIQALIDEGKVEEV